MVKQWCNAIFQAKHFRKIIHYFSTSKLFRSKFTFDAFYKRRK